MSTTQTVPPLESIESISPPVSPKKTSPKKAVEHSETQHEEEQEEEEQSEETAPLIPFEEIRTFCISIPNRKFLLIKAMLGLVAVLVLVLLFNYMLGVFGFGK